MDRIQDMQDFQQIKDNPGNPWVTGRETDSGNEHVTPYVTSEGYQRNQDEVTDTEETKETKEEGENVTSDGRDEFEPTEPITQKELAQKLGVKRPYVGKILGELKKYFPENELYEGRKLSVFAQEQILDYRSLGASAYRKEMEKASNNDSDAGGAIELQKPEMQKPNIPNVEPDILPKQNWNAEKIVDCFSRAQLAKQQGANALQGAIDSKVSTQRNWQTFQETELRDTFAQGWEQGARKAQAYAAGEEAAFQQFLQQMGKSFQNENSQSESE
jgi:hypothetical protein